MDLLISKKRIATKRGQTLAGKKVHYCALLACQTMIHTLSATSGGRSTKHHRTLSQREEDHGRIEKLVKHTIEHVNIFPIP